MIFAVEGHIEMIWNGLFFKTQKMEGINLPIVKTETRRIERGIYQVEAKRKKPHYTGYAVQLKRGVKAESDIRIVMDRIWEETRKYCGGYDYEFCISEKDAWAEGGYTPDEYEAIFRQLNPKWHGWSRWAFKFHVIEVQRYERSE